MTGADALLFVALFCFALAGGFVLVGPNRLERWADRWFGL